MNRAIPLTLILSFFVLMPALLMAAGRGEEITDPLYGVGFPPKPFVLLRHCPPAVEYGTVILQGLIVSVGSSPFTRAALRVENGAETQYYILPEDSAVLNKTDFLTLRGDLVIKTPLFYQQCSCLNRILSYRTLKMWQGISAQDPQYSPASLQFYGLALPVSRAFPQ